MKYYSKSRHFQYILLTSLALLLFYAHICHTCNFIKHKLWHVQQKFCIV